MLRFIFHRTLLMIPTLLGVAVLVFFLLRLMPGDPVATMLLGDAGGANIAPEVIEQERQRLGLHLPLYVQFFKWFWGVLQGDFGISMWTGQSVAYEIGIRLELSLQVAVMATILAILLALPLGTLSAIFKDTWIDQAIRAFSIAGLAVPSFWLGMIIILLLLTYFSWIPPLTFTSFVDDPWENLSQLIWPALAVGYRYSAVSTRMMRSSILEVLQEDYIRTARAKGVVERLVVARHAMRNALLPVVTVISLEFAFLIGGLVVTEQVFNLNGIGKLFVLAVARSDFTMIQALVLLVSVFFVLVNFVMDLMYAFLDPRIRYR
ncbi:MAG TPA: ABC transporter permease [Burkholderiales bacterium]|nr:ABC transporter permease [Burkholderiales bacterium]HSF20406.1 ABC transporter permease [Burkholderiales bacterium]HXV11819.1 ABC transporter permease [Burkholderiales bacterium]